MTALKKTDKVRSLFDKRIEESQPIDDPQNLWLPSEAALELRISRKTLDRIVARNKLRRIKISGTSIYYLVKSEVLSLLRPEKRS